MRGVLLTVEFTAVSNDAAESLIRLLDAYLDPVPPPGGLLSYRVAQHGEHTTRVVIFEEWTDVAMQEAFVARPAFTALMEQIAPLLAESPRANTYDIAGAGPQARTDAE